MIQKNVPPLSPHLTIYKPQISSVLSIMHRITGAALYFGTIPLALWLWGAAYDDGLYECMTQIFMSLLGKIVLIGWSFAFFYHLFNGIRHLFWDIGKGLDLPSVHRSGWAVVIFSLGITGFTWWCILNSTMEQIF